MLPFFYMLFLLAAGSNASPCKPKASSTAPVPAGSSPSDPAAVGNAPPASDSSNTTATVSDAAKLAAGQNNINALGSSSGSSGKKSRCKPKAKPATGGQGAGSGTGSGGSSSIPATAPKAADHIAGGQNSINALGGSSNSSTTGPSSPSSSSQSPPPPGSPGLAPAGGSCPQGFVNTVFNTGAPKSSGWPSTTWSSLASNGVNDWSKFEHMHLSLTHADLELL